MTNQEFNDLHDSLYYGHDAELELDGQRFFIEWENDGIGVYLLNDTNGTKITSKSTKNKDEAINWLFDYEFVNGKNLNLSHEQISIIDIE